MGGLIEDLVDAGGEMLNGLLLGIVVTGVLGVRAVQPDWPHRADITHGEYAIDPESDVCSTEACALLQRLERQRQELRRTINALT